MTPFRKLLSKQWVLPTQVSARFDTLLANGEVALTAFARNDLAKTSELMTVAIAGPLLATVIESVRWRGRFTRYLREIDRHKPPLSDAARSNLQTSLSGVSTMPVDPNMTEIEVDAADAELQRTHGTFIGGNEFLIELSTAVADFLTQTQRQLSPSIDPAAPEWQPVLEATSALQALVAAKADDTIDAQTARVTAQITQLTEAWRTLFEARLEQEAFTEVDALISAGSWTAAIAKADELIQAAQQAVTEGIGEDMTRARAGRRTRRFAQQMQALQLHGADFSLRPAPGAQATEGVRFDLRGNAAERQRLRTTSQRLEVAQTISVALLFVGGAYGLHAEAWVGTLSEMVAIAVLAFGVDLSAEGIVTALRK